MRFFILSLISLGLAACGGGGGSSQSNPPVDDPKALSGTWNLSSVTCNGTASLAFQKDSAAGVQIQFQIQDGSMVGIESESSGCQRKNTQTLKSEGNFVYSVKSTGSTASSQCKNPGQVTDKTYKLNLKVSGKNLTVTKDPDAAEPDMCVLTQQSDPMVATFTQDGAAGKSDDKAADKDKDSQSTDQSGDNQDKGS